MPLRDQEARRAYDAAYYIANRERISLREMAYRKANPEKLRITQSARQSRNREKRRATDAIRYLNNREEILAAAAARHRANPEKQRARYLKRLTRKIGAFVEKVDAEAVFVRDGGVCQICDSFIGTAKWHVDHRVPLSKGGEHSYRNCQLAHATCNMRKGSKTPDGSPIGWPA